MATPAGICAASAALADEREWMTIELRAWARAPGLALVRRRKGEHGAVHRASAAARTRAVTAVSLVVLCLCCGTNVVERLRGVQLQLLPRVDFHNYVGA
jgi:hypothetical protein